MVFDASLVLLFAYSPYISTWPDATFPGNPSFNMITAYTLIIIIIFPFERTAELVIHCYVLPYISTICHIVINIILNYIELILRRKFDSNLKFVNQTIYVALHCLKFTFLSVFNYADQPCWNLQTIQKPINNPRWTFKFYQRTRHMNPKLCIWIKWTRERYRWKFSDGRMYFLEVNTRGLCWAKR